MLNGLKNQIHVLDIKLCWCFYFGRNIPLFWFSMTAVQLSSDPVIICTSLLTPKGNTNLTYFLEITLSTRIPFKCEIAVRKQPISIYQLAIFSTQLYGHYLLAWPWNDNQHSLSYSYALSLIPLIYFVRKKRVTTQQNMMCNIHFLKLT